LRYLLLLIGFLSCLFLVTLSSASDVDEIENKIIMNMIRSFTEQSHITIYTDSQRIKNLLRGKQISFAVSCDVASVAILASKAIKNCNNIPIITLKYALLKVYPSSVGSFFWQKGRPNIVFIESRLREQNISIGDEFTAFVEESIW